VKRSYDRQACRTRRSSTATCQPGSPDRFTNLSQAACNHCPQAMGLTDPANNLPEDHARRVREMFARISPRYDLLNHLLSGNIDKRWRRKTIRKLRPLIPPNP